MKLCPIFDFHVIDSTDGAAVSLRIVKLYNSYDVICKSEVFTYQMLIGIHKPYLAPRSTSPCALDIAVSKLHILSAVETASKTGT